jgi:ferredoxin
MKKCRIGFFESQFPDIEILEGSAFSETLNAQNSPILFGCRIGICGTCAIEVVEHEEPLPARTPEEEEYLAIFAPDRKNCRLACQMKASTHIKLKKTEL